jgi:membrane protein required for colicin V production
MPVSPLDLAVLAIILVSALLASVRGFTREVLAIVSWAAAAVAALYFHPQVLPYTKQYISNPTVALIAAIAAVFLVSLIVVSLITVKISDFILDSKIGPLDRSLGFLFGAARGALIAVVAFMFFTWLIPDKGQPAWVKDSRTRPLLESSGQALVSLLPDDPESAPFLQRLKLRKAPGTDQADADQTATAAAGAPAKPAAKP